MKKENVFYHGSRKAFQNGFELKPQSNGYANSDDASDFEKLMEARRPLDKLSRHASVFLSKDPDLIDGAGGYIDVIYEVRPVSRTEASDLSWYSTAYCEFCTEPMDERAINVAIDAYWSGTLNPDLARNVEYRVSSALVVRVFELNVPKSEPEKVSNNSASFQP